MTKKITKALLSIALCSALAVGAAAVTSYAANDPRTCPHNYLEMIDSYHVYTDKGKYGHLVSGWEQYYCHDCYTYSNVTPVEYFQDHDDTLPCSKCGYK